MKKNSFVGGTLIATLSIIVTKMMGLLYVIPFYKMVGVVGSSLYSYAYNIYAIFLDISTCGLPIAISKIVNEYNTLGKRNDVYKTFYIGKRIMFFLSIVVFLLLFLIAPIIAKVLVGGLENGNSIKSVSWCIRCISFSLLIVPSLSVYKGYLQGHSNIEISGISQIIEQVIRISVVLIGTYFVIKITENIQLAVCVAVMGSFLGALGAFVFVRLKMGKVVSYDRKIDKNIIKKIVLYAIPFIIINVSYSLYNFVDMTIILKTFNWLNYDVNDIEFISGSVTTWAPKINMIVTSVASGMSISLIPSIVNLFTLNKTSDVSDRINQSLQMILFISLPLIMVINLMSDCVWSIFYGYDLIGGNILKINIVLGLFVNLLIVLSSILQGMNKFRLVYVSNIMGFICNIVLDIPLILLFNVLGYGYIGTIVASIVGYGLSVIICIKGLMRECNVCFSETWLVLRKLLVPLLIIAFMTIGVRMIIDFDIHSRFNCLLLVGIDGICCGIIYIIICFKMGIVTKVLGSDIIKKLTFGKLRV